MIHLNHGAIYIKQRTLISIACTKHEKECTIDTCNYNTSSSLIPFPTPIPKNPYPYPCPSHHARVMRDHSSLSLHIIIPNRRKQMSTLPEHNTRDNQSHDRSYRRILIQIYLCRPPNVISISPRTARLLDILHIQRTTPASTMRRANLRPSSPAICIIIGVPTCRGSRQ
jgi:hypothetical protein